MATELVTNSAREEILRKIRAAKGGASSDESARAGWNAVERHYRRKTELPREAVLELLEDRLRDYDAYVIRASRLEVATKAAAILKERGKRRMLLPEGFAPQYLPDGFDFVIDGGEPGALLTADQLDKFDGVMTGATLAIAQTGTVVLQNAPGQGRRAATLVPDYHLCLVDIKDVVETVPEAMQRLQQTAELPTTFVSGPSATADIEMTRIKGVHGPRFLDVIMVG